MIALEMGFKEKNMVHKMVLKGRFFMFFEKKRTHPTGDKPND